MEFFFLNFQLQKRKLSKIRKSIKKFNEFQNTLKVIIENSKIFWIKQKSFKVEREIRISIISKKTKIENSVKQTLIPK